MQANFIGAWLEKVFRAFVVREIYTIDAPY
jgi:hypothetical protein